MKHGEPKELRGMSKSRLTIPGPIGASRASRWFAGLRRRIFPFRILLSEILPRFLDIGIGIVVLAILSPLLIVMAYKSRRQTGGILSGTTMIGRYRIPYRLLSFAGGGRFRGLTVWLNVVRGEMGIVGPRPLSIAEASQLSVDDLVRFTVRPGVISPFRIRSRIGIAHDPESKMDRELVYGQTVKGDLGLAARSVVSGVLGGGGLRAMPAILNLFGIPVLNTSMAEAVRWVMDCAKGTAPRLMAFVNPDCLNIAWNNADYRSVLLGADRVLPDGIGIHLGCRMLGQALRENVNGTDMFPLICEAAARERTPIYLLGARPGIAQAAADRMVERYPGLYVAGTRDGYFDAAEDDSVIDAINASGAKILLVAFGVPRQELWLSCRRSHLAPPVCMGVGGLFDFYSGRIPRAPVWMREIGLEWVFRLIQEPGRMWRRYVIGNPLFLYRIWKQTRHPDEFALPEEIERRMAPPSNDLFSP